VAASAQVSRARRRSPGPQPLAAAIWALVRRHVAEDTIRLLHVRDVWSAVAGAGYEAHTWPAAIVGATLIVHVHDHQWLHELTYMRQALLDRLQALAPAAGLMGLRLRLGEVPPVPQRRPPESSLPAPALAPPRFSPEPDAATRAALDAVGDPELQQILAGARVMLGRG
jgi:predicted nucleic acid-binding Zn ribbon protein